MKIYFVEVESSERQFFESELSNHELHFVSSLEESKGCRDRLDFHLLAN